ncbi:MAG: FAD-dependent oxidoreductase [bacterium]|nr:FAD-dependent oxidoreductase [bacterium]
MDTVKLVINGQEIEAKAGQTILEAVEEHKLDEIPTLCHSPELKPYGSCFVCVVEVEGRPNLLPSCATRVMEGMTIQTRSERVVKSRRTAFELLTSNHYADCVSPCMEGCPAGVDAQGYIALAAMGESRKAVDLVRERNPLPAVCGRICVRKCEMVCRREDVDEPVAINYIKRYVTDQPDAYKGDPVREPGRGKTIGVIGGGPAGLTAAYYLGLKGYDPVIYESMPHAGGMLRYGIPEYRLPKADLDMEIDYVRRAGATILTGQRVGREITIEQLREKHDAVFVAIGAFAGKDMRVEGERDTEGVVTGADYLVDKALNPTPETGTVVVVGGGNTAMDVARTTWRLGAEKVILLYRRTKAEMPADELEIEDCIKEGVEIMELAAPVGIVKEGGKLKALKCIRMKLGEPDDSGRRRPVPMEGSEFELPCRLAVSAIGQEPIVDDLLEGSAEVAKTVNRWKTFDVDLKTMQTSVEGVFAGGDAADDGPTVVIDAIRDGRKAAVAIHRYLSGEKSERDPFIVRKEFWSKPGQAELGEIKQSPRHHMNEIEVEERVGSFDEVATGFEYEDMTHECGRCLSCGCIDFDECKLRLYSEEYGVDMEHFKGQVRKHKIDDRHPYINYDPNKCVLCARCVRTCSRVLPVSALGLINRGFKTEMRPAMNDALAETSCIACGNCVDACPVGALTMKQPFPGRAALTATTIASHCGFCSIGCGINVKRISEDRYWVESSGKPGDYLCQYGRFGSELFIRGRRLHTPRLRDGVEHNQVSFRKAYEVATDGLKAIVAEHGPEAVAVFIHPESSNEEMYLAGRIAREGLGTGNVSSLALAETGGRSAPMDEALGFTASTARREAIADADLIVINNSDMQADVMVLSVDVIDAVKAGAKLITSGSSESPLDTMAAVALDPMRGRAGQLWNGIIQGLIEEGHLDRAEIAKLDGGGKFLADQHDYSIENIAAVSGVDKRRIKAAIEAFKVAKNVVFIHSKDRSRDKSPGDIDTLVNLALLLRAKGLGAELVLPSMAANGAGVGITGADPAFQAGRKAAPQLPGARTREELLTMLREGKIRGALIIGEDPMRYSRLASYFSHIEYLVAVDWALTETTQFANVSIPGSTFLESEGTRCNFEGEMQRFNPAVTPLGGVKTWQVLQNIASTLGVEAPAVFDKINAAIVKATRKALGDKAALYLDGVGNWDGKGKLTTVDFTVKASPRTPSLTAMAHYKREVQEVGIEHFRVGKRR